MKFTVSTYSDFGDEFSSARSIEAGRAPEAAEGFVDENFSNLDYPKEVDVFVRDTTGAITEWTVEVESVPHFHATRKMSNALRDSRKA